MDAGEEVAVAAAAVADAEDRQMHPTEHNNQKDDLFIPDSLLLQWHITERCNLRCAHCYQEGYAGIELPFEDLLAIMEQYKDLLSLWRSRRKNRPVRGHITVTGGEPFVRTDFFDLLDVSENYTSR